MGNLQVSRVSYRVKLKNGKEKSVLSYDATYGGEPDVVLMYKNTPKAMAVLMYMGDEGLDELLADADELDEIDWDNTSFDDPTEEVISLVAKAMETQTMKSIQDALDLDEEGAEFIGWFIKNIKDFNDISILEYEWEYSVPIEKSDPLYELLQENSDDPDNIDRNFRQVITYDFDTPTIKNTVICLGEKGDIVVEDN